MTRQYLDWNFDISLISELDQSVASYKVGGSERPDQEFLDSGLIQYVSETIDHFAHSSDQKYLSDSYWEHFYLSIGLRWGSSDVRPRSFRTDCLRNLTGEDFESMIFEEYLQRLHRYKLIHHQTKKHYLSFSRYFRDSAFQPIGRSIVMLHEPKLVFTGSYTQEIQEPLNCRSTTVNIARLIGMSTRQIQRYLS